MICITLAHIRYDKAHRPIVGTSDIIWVEGASRPNYVHKVAITSFYLENRGGFIIAEWRHHVT